MVGAMVWGQLLRGGGTFATNLHFWVKKNLVIDVYMYIYIYIPNSHCYISNLAIVLILLIYTYAKSYAKFISCGFYTSQLGVRENTPTVVLK